MEVILVQVMARGYETLNNYFALTEKQIRVG